jgi:hypothetical protein
MISKSQRLKQLGRTPFHTSLARLEQELHWLWRPPCYKSDNNRSLQIVNRLTHVAVYLVIEPPSQLIGYFSDLRHWGCQLWPSISRSFY